ncbi:hypothetical protein [Buttiauxella noackiae]|uniref:hypothetical protein n=1 Tax=Buttiauxella noackiae TaxID=82992 RepID=UPI000B01C7B0
MANPIDAGIQIIPAWIQKRQFQPSTGVALSPAVGCLKNQAYDLCRLACANATVP